MDPSHDASAQTSQRLINKFPVSRLRSKVTSLFQSGEEVFIQEIISSLTSPIIYYSDWGSPRVTDKLSGSFQRPARVIHHYEAQKRIRGSGLCGRGEAGQAMGEVWTNSWDKGISHRLWT